MKSDDKEINVYTAGTAGVNSMAQEFFNISENSLKARGIKTKLMKVPPTWISDNAESVDFFAYYSVPGEGKSKAVEAVEAFDKEVRIFRY
jgi:hypothetical protein